MALSLEINGERRELEGLAAPSTLAGVMEELNLKSDRVAVEHNGSIVERGRWGEMPVASGDRLEIVHFVGGG